MQGFFAKTLIFHIFDIPLQFEQAMLKAGTSQADMDLYRNAKVAVARKRTTEIYNENHRLKVVMADLKAHSA